MYLKLSKGNTKCTEAKISEKVLVSFEGFLRNMDLYNLFQPVC